MGRSQLIYVVTVTEYGSVTRAVEKLHLSQPLLSNQIIHLEQEFGVALSARVRERVHLTEAGEVLVRHAQRIFNDMQVLAERMGDYAANRSGRMCIGALPIMCALHIPEPIGGFHSEYPSITLTLQERGSAGLLQTLEQSEINVAFATLNPSEPTVRQTHSLPLFQSEICAAVHADSPLVRRDAIELEQLADQTLITPNQDFNLSGVILSHLSNLGISCQAQNICSQIDSCLVLVNKNMGISFCSYASADYYRYPNVVLVPIKPATSRMVYLVYKKDLAFHPFLQHSVRFAAESQKINVIL